MADDGDRSALIILWVVTVAISVAFGLGIAVVLGGRNPSGVAIASFGLAGVCVGALVASLIAVTRRKGAGPERRAELQEVLDRLRSMELDPQRMTELEERVDFAERMLARAQDEGLLPGARRDGPQP